jgi:hypothetical protein
MKKNLILLPALMLALAFVACRQDNSKDNDENANGAKVAVYLTDHATPLFSKVLLHIVKMEIKIEDNGVDSLGGWRNLNITPGVFDILRFRNGFDTLFATATIPPNRKLQKIRFTLGNQNSVVLLNGNSFPLEVKDNRNEVEANLDDSNVDFIPPDQLMFWIDFDAHQSIKSRDNDTRFELKSKIKIFTKSRSGRIEGRVLPSAAQAIVKAINGTDTATALPEADGKFKIVALRAGIYKVLFDATANNYLDSIVNNVGVQNNQDTQMGTVVLRQ